LYSQQWTRRAGAVDTTVWGSDMIGPAGLRSLYFGCGAQDMRKGIAGLSALTRMFLRQKPTSAAVFASSRVAG